MKWDKKRDREPCPYGIAGFSVEDPPAAPPVPRLPPLTAHPVRVEVRRNSGKMKGVEGQELFKGGTGT